MITKLGFTELHKSYNNIGLQCGGWSVRWQGFMGNSQWEGENKKSSNASSVLDALMGMNLENVKIIFIFRLK